LHSHLSIDLKAAAEYAKPQAATKFLSHAGENVSRKSRKPAQLSLKLFPSNIIIKLISINGEYQHYFTM